MKGIFASELMWPSCIRCTVVPERSVMIVQLTAALWKVGEKRSDDCKKWRGERAMKWEEEKRGSLPGRVSTSVDIVDVDL